MKSHFPCYLISPFLSQLLTFFDYSVPLSIKDIRELAWLDGIMFLAKEKEPFAVRALALVMVSLVASIKRGSGVVRRAPSLIIIND